MTRDRSAIVVGAGVIGVTTAEALLRRGLRVTVVDAGPKAAEGNSKANAAQLCSPFALALGSPGFVRALPRVLLDPSSGVSLALASGFAHWKWLLRFLVESRPRRSAANTDALLELAHLSAAALEQLLTRHPLEFSRRVSGKLWIAPDRTRLDGAAEGLHRQRAAGFEVSVLSQSECLLVEPRLADSGYEFAGAVYGPESAVGDCHAFTVGLANKLEALGVNFRYSMSVDGLITTDGMVAGVRCGEQDLSADMVVLANGSDAMPLLPRFPGWAPVAPLRGYSVTLPLGSGAPALSLTDAKRAVAFCRLGDRLRVTGSAEFAGLGAPSLKAIDRIIGVARTWTPEAADFDCTERMEWCGVRATTPSSMPMIGPAGLSGLYVNVGHGSLGWTLAAGSAERLVAML